VVWFAWCFIEKQECSNVLNGTGLKYYNNKKYGKAIAAWNMLIKEYTLFSDAYFNIAKSFSKEGNNADAIKFYELAKQKLKDNPFYSVEENYKN
jgi:tetratricopeptide (TPR) repeat protein